MQDDNKIVKIKVIGVGGGGNNTINSMVQEGMSGIDFIVANTDQQVLNSSNVENKITLGISTKGLGAGADPEIGFNAAVESQEEIKKILQGADMVILASGMGGGTGTGASPIIAKIAKELGALVVGVITTPFSFEGTRREENAKLGMENLKKEVDSLITVSNDRLLEQFGSISLKDSFMYADKVVKQTIRTITDLLQTTALINLDFADISTVIKDKGSALIGIGRASGNNKAVKAAEMAFSSPILESSIKGAKDAIINISGGDITLDEANLAVQTIKEAAGNDLNIIFGVSIIESLGNDLQVSIIATGVSEKQEDEKEIETLIFQTQQEFAEPADNIENLNTNFKVSSDSFFKKIKTKFQKKELKKQEEDKIIPLDSEEDLTFFLKD